MAHHNQLKFIELIANEVFCHSSNLKILEIGAYNVNGLDLRNFFNSPDYTATDLIIGPNIDLVCPGQEINHPDNTYDITISCECFEHNPHWKLTLFNMIRMTKEDGYVIFSCATDGRIEHGTLRSSPESSPGTQSNNINYYKNLTVNDFDEGSLKYLHSYKFIINNQSHDLYFVGIKKAIKQKNNLSDNLIEKINSIREKKSILFSIWKIPLSLAHKILSEEKYQIFGIAWHKFGHKIKKVFL